MKIQAAVLWTVLALAGAVPAFADEGIGRRLQTIEEQQEQILAKLDTILTELQIVKVRATD